MEQDPSTTHNAWIRNGKVLNQVLALICCRSKMGTRHLGGTNNQKTQDNCWHEPSMMPKTVSKIHSKHWRCLKKSRWKTKLDIKPSYRVCLNTIQCHEKITSNGHPYLQLLILWLKRGYLPTALWDLLSLCIISKA